MVDYVRLQGKRQRLIDNNLRRETTNDERTITSLVAKFMNSERSSIHSQGNCRNKQQVPMPLFKCILTALSPFVVIQHFSTVSTFDISSQFFNALRQHEIWWVIMTLIMSITSFLVRQGAIHHCIAHSTQYDIWISIQSHFGVVGPPCSPSSRPMRQSLPSCH